MAGRILADPQLCAPCGHVAIIIATDYPQLAEQRSRPLPRMTFPLQTPRASATSLRTSSDLLASHVLSSAES